MQRTSILPALKTNFYIFAVLSYSVILVYNYLRAGVLFQFDLGILALIVLPIILYVLHTTKKSEEMLFVRQWIPFVVILLGYEALQGTTGSTIDAHLNSIVNLYPYDRMLWSFDVTGTVQRMFFSQFMTDFMLFFYSLHFYMVITASVVLWLFRRSLFTKYAIAITITSYVSLMIFAIMPTAPPWYTGVACNLANPTLPCNLAAVLSTTTTGTVQSTPPVLSQFAHFDNMIESDKFAAFPSLHAAYVTLFCAFMIKFKRKLAAVMIPLEFAVLFSTLYLGQHYIIDLIAGVSLAIASVFIADYVSSKYSEISPVSIPPSLVEQHSSIQKEEELESTINSTSVPSTQESAQSP